MASDYCLFFVIFCHTDTQILRYADRCSHLLAIVMTSNQLPEVVVGFADPLHPWKIFKLSLKYWRNKHHLRQESMPVIPVNPNHPAARAVRKRTLSAIVCKSPPRAAKIRANSALMHGAPLLSLGLLRTLVMPQVSLMFMLSLLLPLQLQRVALLCPPARQ